MIIGATSTTHQSYSQNHSQGQFRGMETTNNEFSGTNSQYSANSTENNSQNVEKFTKSSLQHQHLKSNEEIENQRQVPPPLKHPSSSTGDLLPGIDLDAVALMMQGGKGKLSNLIN